MAHGEPLSSSGEASAELPQEGRFPETSWEPNALARILFDVVGLALGVGYTALAIDLGAGTMPEPGPGFFPRAVGGLIVTCLAIDLLLTVRKVMRGQPLRGKGRMPLGALAILATLALYLFLVSVLGHALTGSAVVALLLTVLGRRSWWKVALISVMAGFGTDLLFTQLLGLRLPDGIWNIGWSAWM